MRALLSQRLTLRFAVLALLAAVALAATATVAFARYATTEALPTDSTVAVEDLYVRVYGEGPYDDNDGWGPYYLRYVGNEEVVDVAEDLDAQGCILGTKVTSTYKLFEAPHADVRQVLLPDVALLASDVDGQVLAANLFGNGVGDRAIDVMYRDGVKTEAEGEGPHAAADLTATAFDGCTNATTYLYVTEAHLEGEPGHRIFKQEVPHAYVSNEVQGIRCLFKMNADLTAVLFDPHPNPAWTTMSDGGMVGTFYCCTGLVELPGQLRHSLHGDRHGQRVLGCTNLASLPDALALPDGVVSLSRAFQYCRSLASLPDSLVLRSGIVGDGLYATFNGCESLTSLPKGVRIPLGASNRGALFQNCKSLVLPNDFTLAPSVTSANRAFASCSSLTSLPSGFRLPSDLSVDPGHVCRLHGLGNAALRLQAARVRRRRPRCCSPSAWLSALAARRVHVGSGQVHRPGVLVLHVAGRVADGLCLPGESEGGRIGVPCAVLRSLRCLMGSPCLWGMTDAAKLVPWLLLAGRAPRRLCHSGNHGSAERGVQRLLPRWRQTSCCPTA